MRHLLVRETSCWIHVGFEPVLLVSTGHDNVVTMLAVEALWTIQSATADNWPVLSTRDLERAMLAIEARYTTCNNTEVRLLVAKATFRVVTLLANELLFSLRIT